MVMPSHVRVYLDVINNDLTSDIGAPALKFQETRTSPYIEGGSADYLCSIIRFSIQTGRSLPVFIPRIGLRQKDVKKTVYAITPEIKGTFGAKGKLTPKTLNLQQWMLQHPRQKKTLQRQDHMNF